MIDTRRWVLAEAWLSLGLRVEWMSEWEADRFDRELWMRDEEERTDYVYKGRGVWAIRGQKRTAPGYPRDTSPQMGTDAMAHELAHYLSADEGQRGLVNFGLTRGDDEAEQRAVDVERVIDAIVSGASRIAGLALAGRRP